MRKQLNKWFSHSLAAVKSSESPKSFSDRQVQLSAVFSVFASDDNDCRLEQRECHPNLLCRYFNETSLP